jgi:protein-tyrosine-phosphatase
MAQAICNREIARRLGVPLEALDRFGVKAVSAGLRARPGEPLTTEARSALAGLEIPSLEHRSANLTRRLAAKAEVIFCMTEGQRQELMSMFPDAAEKVHLLQPLADIQDPADKGSAAFRDLAALLQQVVGNRLTNLGIMEAA